MRTVVDSSIPVAAYIVGSADDPDRLDSELDWITDEEWESSGGCPCGRYHGQRDGAVIHCAYVEP